MGDHQVVPCRLRPERLTGICCPRCVEQIHGLGFPGAGLASIGEDVISQAAFPAQGPLGGDAGLSGFRAQAVPRDQALELLGGLPRNIRSDQVVFPLHFEPLKSSWRRACARAGISDLRFHDLRHEATSRFFEKGLNVMEVAAITGHKDLRMLQRYTHLRAEDLALKLG